MKDKVLVDTNILVYAYDISEPEKQAKAFLVLDGLASARRGVLSPQILAEFFVACTQKIAVPLNPETVYRSLQNYLNSWLIVDLTPQIVLEAARGKQAYRLPYWDAQIWATAKLNQIPLVYSEDFQDGMALEGVLFKNPFGGR
ncbi:MAG: PIN domain-containing protein [Bacillota bacterium]